MAAFSIFCVLLVLLFSMPEIHATTVEVTVPVHPVTVGGVLAIQCEIWNFEDGHIVKMFHVTESQIEELTTGLAIIPTSSFEQRIFLARRNTLGGTTVFFATIIDISMLDEGEYLCRVYTPSGRDYVKVAEDAVDMEVYFLPDKIYPQCQSTPRITENVDENIQLKLSCISAKGSPAVSLRWTNNLNQELVSRSVSQDDTVSSEFNVRTSASLHDTIFICEMTNPGFTDFKRTCHIGPITINTNSQNTAIVNPSMPIAPTQKTKDKTLISSECSTKCPPDDEFTILCLSVATIGASMLTIIFLITTIVMCFKYRNASNNARNAQRNITTTDGSEPVYVSLQRRPEPVIPERRSIYKEPDRSSLYSAPERRSLKKESETYKDPDTNSTTYMSVEDPNNPGSKVLMPKEVFEEFYNSLTLKRV